jgi:hypothetical protein
VDISLKDVKKESCPLHHHVLREREMNNAQYMRGDAFRKCNVSLVCKSMGSTWAKQYQNTYTGNVHFCVGIGFELHTAVT